MVKKQSWKLFQLEIVDGSIPLLSANSLGGEIGRRRRLKIFHLISMPVRVWPKAPKNMKNYFYLLTYTLVILFIGNFVGWVNAHSIVAKECERLGAFYVGNVTYSCQIKSNN